MGWTPLQPTLQRVLMLMLLLTDHADCLLQLLACTAASLLHHVAAAKVAPLLLHSARHYRLSSTPAGLSQQPHAACQTPQRQRQQLQRQAAP